MASFTIIYATFLFWVTLVAAWDSVRPRPNQRPATVPMLGQPTSQGCFGSIPATATRGTKLRFNTPGACTRYCKVERKHAVSILHIDRCFCADIYPIRVSRVDDSHCSWPCPGYDKDACGGAWAYSVFNTGLEVDVEYEGDDSSNTAADASASTSTIMANADPATSDPSQCSESTLTILKDVVDEVKMVAGKFIKKIQAIFKESTEETKELEEEMDL